MYEEILNNILKRTELANIAVTDVITIYIIILEEMEAYYELLS